MTTTLSPQSMCGVKVGLLLAAQAHGDDRGEAAQHQPVGVDSAATFLHVGSLERKGFHGSFFP